LFGHAVLLGALRPQNRVRWIRVEEAASGLGMESAWASRWRLDRSSTPHPLDAVRWRAGHCESYLPLGPMVSFIYLMAPETSGGSWEAARGFAARPHGEHGD
jgi:hypothetical protein